MLHFNQERPKEQQTNTKKKKQHHDFTVPCKQQETHEVFLLAECMHGCQRLCHCSSITSAAVFPYDSSTWYVLEIRIGMFSQVGKDQKIMAGQARTFHPWNFKPSKEKSGQASHLKGLTNTGSFTKSTWAHQNGRLPISLKSMRCQQCTKSILSSGRRAPGGTRLYTVAQCRTDPGPSYT